ncbi:DNA polymerase III subunit alpha [Clostridium sediminicola]|uniref:DNA polymerase III subunit alpha n=1 Tax=Clostridium sediminicola TaxID=3114879 RepID=UPI0031F224AE
MDKENNFVHLHVHTEFSLLDGSGKISKIIKKAKDLGMKSLAITDHGAMYGCVEFYKRAKENGIKPIIGCEVYIASKSMYIKRNDKENKTHHLVLLVKNQKGYENLMKIVSKASEDGFYYKPRVDLDFLKNHSEGLIALSACLAGEVQWLLNHNQGQKAKEMAIKYKEIFKEGFYLELQYHKIPEQLKVNDQIVKLSKELDIPMVATNDVHYINREDSKAHEVLLCIQTGKTLDDKDRMSFPSDEFYLKSEKEMRELFSYAPEAIDNTAKIAQECNFDYEFHVSKLPNYPLSEGTSHYEYLKELCYKGLRERYKEITEELDERLQYELRIINEMGYVDYFLIVWDFMDYCVENNIMTGPGRGSAAGSLVAFTLGITKIDPIKYNLIFERFLNPERVSMPDIDSDFCYERRGDVIDYVVKKYGEQNVAQIVTFGTMAARACIRDVGRAMNYSYVEVDKIAKMIPTVLGITIDKALDMNSELQDNYDDDERVAKLIDIAKTLEGLPRHTSTHAAGVVIASKPLVNYVPLLKNEESIVTQFTMTELEELGLLKMDFLGLRTLTVLRDTIQLVKENKGITLDLDNIDFNDKKVYEMIGKGKTVGVFQLESAGMTSFMKDLKPESLEDIIAGISLYRPGPMAEIPRYIKNKHNPEDIQYAAPQLKNILDVTYGCMVYQEQVMQIVRDLAGYSMGRSDLVRRAMSKKKHKVMEEERKNFIYGIEDDEGNITLKGCVRNGISIEAANKIYDSMMDFASYAFNKSHAAAYAVVGYYTAYCVCYYPHEFMAAMLNSIKGNSDKVAVYTRAAKDMGIEIIPPNINESYSKFTVKEDKIQFGLTAIKNVGENIIDNICEVRDKKGKFKSFEDFCSKIDTNCINKRVIESLIRAGAYDCMNIYRSKLLAVFELMLDSIANQKKKNIDGQMSLFATNEEQFEEIKIKYPDLQEFDKRNLLSMEKEMTGLYLSGHPLEEYKETLRKSTSIKLSDITEEGSLEDDILEEAIQDNAKVQDGDRVIIGGIISTVTKKITRNNNMMAFISVEDLYGSVEVIVFPKILDKYKNLIQEDGIVLLKGRVTIREDEQPKVICDTVENIQKISTKKLYILINHNREVKKIKDELKLILEKNKGNIPVYICTKENGKFMLSRELWVNGKDELLTYLIQRFGQNNVKIV